MKKGRVLRKRILVADDEPLVREALRQLLGLDEHTVKDAPNGVEAFELFKNDEFDLIITDYTMPEMNGNELAAKIKQLKPLQPILMITAYNPELNAPKNPVDLVLKKPFTLQDLRDAIAKVLS
jgi:two-component system, NtrC family, response regulator AtoC